MSDFDIHSQTPKTDAKREAYKKAYPLHHLIRAEDVRDDAESWAEIRDEDIEEEVNESLSVMRSEGQYYYLQKPLAVRLKADDMMRIRMDDLVFDDRHEAVKNGYWPHKMTRQQVFSHLFEDDVTIESGYYDDAWEVISQGIADKMNPRKEEPDYL